MSTTVPDTIKRTVTQKLSERPSVLDFDAGGSDDTIRFQRAMAWASSKGGASIYVPRGGYTISDTLELPSATEFFGDWSRLGALKDSPVGTQIKWAGPANTPILRAFDTHGLHLHHLQIHGGQVAGCTGLLIDSDNAPSSSGNSYDHLQFNYIGAPAYPGGYPADGTAIKIGSTLSGFEMDATWFRNVQVYFCHTGYWFNSANSGQGAYILGGEISFVTHGIRIDRTGGLLSVTNCFGSLGLPNGTDECAWIYINGFHSILIFNQCQVEAGFGKFLLVDAAAGSAAAGSEIYLNGCVANHEIAIRSQHRIFFHGGYATSDVVLAADNSIAVVESFRLDDPATYGASPFSAGHVAVTNGSNVIQLVIGGYLAAGCTATDTLLTVAASPYDYVVGSLYGLDNEVVKVTALTDATHVTVVRAQIETAAAAHSPQIMNLFDNVHTPGWDDWQSRSTITIGGGIYTLTVTGFMSGTLDQNYAGATDPAAAYILVAPVRDFVQSGVNTLLYRIGPQSGGSMQDIDNTIENFPSLRLRALNGVVNPAMQFLNGSQKWNLLYPSAAGLIPNGFGIYNETDGVLPFGIYPGAPGNSLLLTASGPVLEPAPEVTASDLAPYGRLDSRYYFAYVSGVPVMDGSNTNGYPASSGSIFGFTLSLGSYTPSWQLFHGTDSRLWMRAAKSDTVWGPWHDLTSGAPLIKGVFSSSSAQNFPLSGTFGVPLVAGLYRVNWYLVITAGGSGTSVGVGPTWNDGTNIYSGAITSTGPATGQSQSGSKVIRDAGIAAGTLNVIFTGISSPPTYTIYYSVETLD